LERKVSHHTGVTGNSGAVLDGSIDMFLEASLASRIKGTDALAGTAEEEG